MDILITGGTGFIGSVLARRCIELGHAVSVLGQTNNDWEGRRALDLQADGVNVVVGSILDSQLLAKACEGKSAVVHLAAAQHEKNVGVDFYRDVNVSGTRNLLEACLSAGVPRFVHGSTIGVYGSAHDGPLDEDSPPHPDNIYGITKLEGERLANAYADRLTLTIARISETYGPEDKRLLTLFRGVAKGWFPLIGSGRNRHQPIFVDDLVQSLITLASTDKAAGEVINLAGPEPVSTNDMITSAEEAVGRHAHKVHVPLAPLNTTAYLMEKIMTPLGLSPPLTRRRLDFFRKDFWFNTARTAALLGSAPAVKFSEGAVRTVNWYQSNGLI